MAGWDTFAEIAGGAAATMTGLLFVAVSIRIDYIAGSAELRNRAGQTLTLFGTVLVIAVLLAIPGQAYRTLGAEVIALAVITSVSLAALDRRAGTASSGQEIARVLRVLAPNQVSSVLVLVPGIVLAVGTRAGLYVLVVPILVGLVSGVTTAWLLLARITDVRSTPSASSAPAYLPGRGDQSGRPSHEPK